jgi:hypothetical protein
MFFDLEDYASTYRNTVSPGCIDPTEPKVDNSSIECDSIVSTNCVVTAKGYPYLGIGYQETLTSVIEKIKEKFKSISFTILNLGSGIGLLKSFSGGVLSAKSIKAGNNIVITDANDTLTINVIGGGSGGGVINITHADLLVAKNASTLVPGTYYRITDFRTMYDQPDYDSAGVPKTSVAAKQGPVEPIIVLALKNNTLSTKAYQEAYPKDSIEYILEFTTPVNQTVTKGRIIYRKDEWNNETDFDHRNVLFKRYQHPIRPTLHISYKDTSLPSAEYKFTTNTVQQTTYKNKSIGHFNRFKDSLGSIPFDLPNIVLNPQSVNIFRELSFDTHSNNLTLMAGLNSSFNESTNSLFEVIVSESIIKQSINSEIFRNPINPSNLDSYGIHKANINGIFNSKIILEKIYVSPYLALSNVYSDDFDLMYSSVKLTTSDAAPLSGIPARKYYFTESKAWIVDLSNSSIEMTNSDINIEPSSNLNAVFSDTKIANMTSCTGNVDFNHVNIGGVSNVNFLDNNFVNVSGLNFSNIVMKQNAEISNTNILTNFSGINISSANIIYQQGSKEVIATSAPSTLLIKHYDQFGASVINNVNA